ncbi:MAG: GAF domain-containing protein [Planctomycetes bacterium]|nr:GAF domain-containing protein [Planctomycetota bacterium]
MTDNKPELLRFLRERVEEVIAADDAPDRKLERVCRMLADGLTTFDWVGIYRVDAGRRELVLGPYVGQPTEHVRIPFGRGVCGQVAESRRTLVVNDVAAEPNYLSCSAAVRSEIVVPIFRGGAMVAQLDIDSHTAAAFAAEERRFVEDVAAHLGELI